MANEIVKFCSYFQDITHSIQIATPSMTSGKIDYESRVNIAQGLQNA